MTDFEDRVRRIAREAMSDLGHDPQEIDQVIEPPGADYCIINFRDEAIAPIEVSRPLGAGETQERDDIVSALQQRLRQI